MENIQSRPPLPPFTLETAIQKLRAAEDGWNSRDPAGEKTKRKRRTSFFARRGKVAPEIAESVPRRG
jgi:nuclear transport factor 2 (NTF2) superfamily protein